MTPKQADRLALQLLQDNCDTPTFEVQVEPEQFEALAGAFERLGHRIEAFEPRSRMTVHCAPQAQPR